MQGAARVLASVASGVASARPLAGGPERRRLTAMCAALAAMLPLAGHGQAATPITTPVTTTGLKLTLTASEANPQSADLAKRSDQAVSLQPSIHIARRGANFGLTADLGVELVSHTHESLQDRVLPTAKVDLDAMLVDQWAYLDASADVRTAASDPFLGSADVLPGGNQDTLSTYRVSPYLAHDFSPRVSLAARAEESFTTSTQDASTDLRSRRLVARLSQKPLPFGAAIEVSRQDIEYDERSDDDLSTEAIRASVSYTFDGQFLLGATAGEERNELHAARTSDSLVGLQFQWVPGPRTDLRLVAEKRFFGTGWEASLRHRTPFLSFALALSRQPVGVGTTPTLAGDNDLTRYLDAILTTRFPDAQERSTQVDALVRERGLAAPLPDAVSTLADYAQLVTKLNVGIVWLGPRNTFSLSGYRQALGRLRLPGDTAGAGDALFDTRQSGAAFEFNRRLTPQTSLSASVAWSKVEGAGARTGDESQERSYRLGISTNLSPRASVSAGLQYRQFRTTVRTLLSYDETTGFLALNYRR